MSKAIVIYNPAAGSAAAVNEMIVGLADRHECDLVALSAPAELNAAVEKAAQSGARRIIVAGGDGTISHAANVLLSQFREVDLGILPLGTANDLSRSLGLPLGDLPAAFEIAVNRPAIKIDAVRVRNGATSYFVNAATGGFGGEVTAALTDTNKHTWGPFAYWMAAAAKLTDLHAYDLEIELDGEPSNMRIYGIGMANGKYAGGGFPVGGSALLDDGLMDITIIPELPTLELLGAAVSFILGTQTTDQSNIVTKRASRVMLRTQPAMSFSFDGEQTKSVDASFEVLPRVLNVVPGDNPAVAST